VYAPVLLFYSPHLSSQQHSFTARTHRHLAKTKSPLVSFSRPIEGRSEGLLHNIIPRSIWCARLLLWLSYSCCRRWQEGDPVRAVAGWRRHLAASRHWSPWEAHALQQALVLGVLGRAGLSMIRAFPMCARACHVPMPMWWTGCLQRLC